jgi:hypothetical protein
MSRYSRHWFHQNTTRNVGSQTDQWQEMLHWLGRRWIQLHRLRYRHCMNSERLTRLRVDH